MLTFNEKYICAYNQNTFQHYLLKIDLQSHILNLPPLFFSYPYSIHHSASKTIDPKLKQLLAKYKGNHDSDSIVQSIKVINFKQIFQKMGICIQLCPKKQIYIAELDRYCQFQQLTDVANCMPIQFVEPEVILLRFSYVDMNSRQKFIYENEYSKTNERKLHDFRTKIEIKNQKNSNINDNQISQADEIKQRDRSRSIGQIMQYVRKWRHIADEGINGTKLNLQEAAAYVGIPKKSLDDYFYQLRVGQKYGFNFQNNLQRNISFLRKFVKQKIPSRNRSKQSLPAQNQEVLDQSKLNQNALNTASKLPKKLKQPTQFKLFANVPINQPQPKQKQPLEEKIGRLSDSQVSSIPRMWPNPNIFLANDKQKDLVFDDEDSFFNDFKFGHQNYISFNHLMRPDGGNENNNEDNL